MIDPRIEKLHQGGCALLALELHDAAGWQLALLCDPGSGPYHPSTASTEEGLDIADYVLFARPVHVVARPPEGGWVDASGWHREGDLVALARTFGVDELVAGDVGREIVADLSRRGALGRSEADRKLAQAVKQTIVDLVAAGAPFDSKLVADTAGLILPTVPAQEQNASERP